MVGKARENQVAGDGDEIGASACRLHHQFGIGLPDLRQRRVHRVGVT